MNFIRNTAFDMKLDDVVMHKILANHELSYKNFCRCLFYLDTVCKPPAWILMLNMGVLRSKLLLIVIVAP